MKLVLLLLCENYVATILARVCIAMYTLADIIYDISLEINCRSEFFLQDYMYLEYLFYFQ